MCELLRLSLRYFNVKTYMVVRLVKYLILKFIGWFQDKTNTTSKLMNSFREVHQCQTILK